MSTARHRVWNSIVYEQPKQTDEMRLALTAECPLRRCRAAIGHPCIETSAGHEHRGYHVRRLRAVR